MAVNGPRRDPLILCANERGTGEKRESGREGRQSGSGTRGSGPNLWAPRFAFASQRAQLAANFNGFPFYFRIYFYFSLHESVHFCGMVRSTELHVKYGCEMRHGKRRRLPSLGAQRSVHKMGAYCRIDRLKIRKKKEKKNEM